MARNSIPSAGYLYITPDDRHPILWSTDEPTSEDLSYARVSIRLIVRLSDWRYYGTERKWLPIREATLIRVRREDGFLNPPVHVPPTAVRPREKPTQRRR